jgi:putative FmdB family regulatory protein
MPIYEYRCGSCGFEAEFLQKVSDPIRTECPECGKATFQKLVSAAGFQLKGNGWYVTDFRNKDNGKGAKPEASKDSGASAEKDSKPADKKENPAETKKEQSVSGT